MITTLALNCSNAATTQYLNYVFEDMCCIDRITLGIKRGGLYRLDHGDTDDGNDIDAGFALARTNFGTIRKKRIRKLYAIGESTAGLRTTIGSDGEHFEEYFFKSGIASCRRKDTSAVMFSIMFQNVAGSRFKLSQLHAVIVAK